MKRLQVLLLVALSSTLLLTGCGEKKEEKPEVEAPVVEQIIDDPPEEEESPEEAVEEETSEDAPPLDGMVRSRITNEWVDEEVNNTRPLAIMTPNTKTASQYGISDADVLYECNVEGSITRLMWVIQDWRNADKLGNIKIGRAHV